MRLSRRDVLFLLLGIAPCAYAPVLVPRGVVAVLDEPFERFLLFAGGNVYALEVYALEPRIVVIELRFERIALFAEDCVCLVGEYAGVEQKGDDGDGHMRGGAVRRVDDECGV